MYKDIGVKIKVFAIVVAAIIAIGSVIFSFDYIGNADYIEAILTILCGVLIAWVSSFMLFSWGQVVDDVRKTRDNTQEIVKNQRELLAKSGEKTEAKE